MKERISLTLLRDWHLVGVVTSIMALAYLSATFPWGKGVYSFIWYWSPLKATLGFLVLLLMLRSIARTMFAGFWLVASSIRKNEDAHKYLCRPVDESLTEKEIKCQKRGLSIQYFVIAIFLTGTAFALFFSIYIALGAKVFKPFNYSVLTLGIAVTAWSALSQVCMRWPKLIKNKTIRRIAFVAPQK